MAINEENQRLQFGGFNWVSAFYGWLVATALVALLSALLTAAGATLALTNGVALLTSNATGIGLVSALALLVAMGISYYAGGYVAGRMSRFDGGRQGLGVWIMGLIATAILAIAGALFGANYNLLQQLNLPHIPVNQGAFTTGGLVTLLLGLAVTLVAAIAGAKVGEAYHRRVDEAGAIETSDEVYRPVETARPAAPSEPVQTVETDQYERGYTRRDAQPMFGERIERRERDARERK
ncbi:MAG: hypothetical protein NVSMB39_0730 [Candidatus Saccharimonadales bacterium]